MSTRKMKFVPTMKNSIDYYNFCTANNDLPILNILSERFSRTFRVSLSNYLRMITNIEYTDQKTTFGDWVNDNPEKNCMFISTFQKFISPVLIKLDRKLSYGILDVLTGGSGQVSSQEMTKEMTQIELSLLKEVGELMIRDINMAWSPVCQVKAKYVRTEINSMFVGIVPPDAKMIKVNFKVSFNGVMGNFEILYPYSTLFPMRNELFSTEA